MGHWQWALSKIQFCLDDTISSKSLNSVNELPDVVGRTTRARHGAVRDNLMQFFFMIDGKHRCTECADARAVRKETQDYCLSTHIAPPFD